MYDVIVIGARVAGSATAMLLARQGVNVLAVDQAAFPSDTLSTHQVQLPGVARLERWGLLSRIAATGTPATRQVRFDSGGAMLDGCYPTFEGVDALYSPRRTLLDAILVEAAREAGAEVRERFAIVEIVVEDGVVTGVRGREPGGSPVRESARIVIGADGRHSLLARTVAPRVYDERPALTFGYYTYWEGLPVDGGEMYGRGARMIGAWPTNDGLVMTYVAGPIGEFHAFRDDIAGNLLGSLDLDGDLGERARTATRAERYYGTANTANTSAPRSAPDGRWSATPDWPWTRSLARESRTPCAIATCWPTRSRPASTGAGRSRRRSATTSARVTTRSSRCTTSPPRSPRSHRPGSSKNSCLRRSSATPSRRSDSSACAPARSRSPSSSAPRTFAS